MTAERRNPRCKRCHSPEPLRSNTTMKRRTICPPDEEDPGRDRDARPPDQAPVPRRADARSVDSGRDVPGVPAPGHERRHTSRQVGAAEVPIGAPRRKPKLVVLSGRSARLRRPPIVDSMASRITRSTRRCTSVPQAGRGVLDQRTSSGLRSRRRPCPLQRRSSRRARVGAGS